MRANTLSIDMDFRIIPSAVPLHSPSPDRKTINVITPTISPNAIEIKKNITPTKARQGERQKQNTKFINQLQTQLKYHSHSNTQNYTQSGSDYFTALKQKDEVIKNLRNIIDMVTQSTRYKRPNQEQEFQLKNQVKILTIENQKLVNIIEKMSKNKNNEEGNGKKSAQYESKINQLMQTIKENQNFYQEETKELKRFNKSLNTQYRNLENEKKQLQLQNKKLLKILKQKNEGQKMKNSDTIDHSISVEEKSMNTNKSQQRLTLTKIREQHSENLKMLKQGLIKQIQQTFDTMRIALQGINSKINSLSKRLQSIQKVSWQRVKKTHIQRQSITISIRQGEVQEGGETDRSFKFERRNNSEIYIQQGPSSSHERASRDQFTRLEQIPSQKNLAQTLPLVDQLNSTKAELYELRFKYEKLCLDTSSVGFSQRIKQEQEADKLEKYQECVKVLEEKQRQIVILYEQVKRIQQENMQKMEQKNKQIAQRDQQIVLLKQNEQKDFSQHHEETQKKINLLVENYQQQIQILRRQISNLNNRLSLGQTRTTEQISKQNEQSSPYQHQIQKQQNCTLIQNQSLKQEIILLQEKYEHQSRLISDALSQTQLSLNEERKKKQLMQQNMLALSSELNQHRTYIDSLKLQVAQKYQQFERMKDLKQQLQESLERQIQNSRKYKDLIIERENQIINLRKTIAQFEAKNLLHEIQQISSIFERQFKQARKTQNEEEQISSIIHSQLEQQLRETKQKLLKCETSIVQQQAKIYELQNLYELTKNKLKEQQQLAEKLANKYKVYESRIERYRVKKEKDSQILDSVGKNIAIKLDALKKLQMQRIQQGRSALQAKGGHDQQTK